MKGQPQVNIINPIPQCLLVQFEDKRDLSLSFCRIQEFHESKLADIKGVPASFAEFIHAHMDSKGVITYFNEWEGYNFNDKVWRKWLPWERTKHEKQLISIMEDKLDTRAPFYVIGTLIGDNDTVNHELAHAPFYVIGTLIGDNDTVNHELAHALWYLDSNYHKMARAILKVFKENDCFDYGCMLTALSNMGYHNDVLEDELQAYMSTGTIAELREIDFHEVARPYINRFRFNFKGALNEQQTL